MSESRTEESEWTRENVQKLLAALKSSIPECDRSVYTQTLKNVDWDNVAFPPFSPEACKEKWSDILRKIRKTRTLTEIIVEAEDVFSNRGIHPEQLKKPSRPHAIFFKENRAKLQEQHPELNGSELFRTLIKQFNTLPDEEKAPYVEQFQIANKEYKKRKREFRKQDHTHPTPQCKTNQKRKRISADTSDIHPEQLKKPSRPHSIFFKENRAKLQEQHPELNGSELFRTLIKQFNTLPNEEKAPYVEKFQIANKEFKQRKREFRKQDHTHPTNQKRKRISADTSDGEQEGLPPKPPVNGFALFRKEQLASMDGACVRDWFQLWHDLTETQRDEYSKRCRCLKTQYPIKLNEYLKTFDEEEQQQILKRQKTKKVSKRNKTRRKHLTPLPGEPKMPSRSSNACFFKEQMVLLKEKYPITNVRFGKVSQMWQELPMKEKERYKEKARENIRKYSMELQKWFKTLTPAEQQDYRTCNYRKSKFLSHKISKVYSYDLSPYRPSDSEDEDIENSSSSDEVDDDSHCDEVDEEEDEEDDITFDMF